MIGPDLPQPGSLYWIINRVLCCRQEIIQFRLTREQMESPAFTLIWIISCIWCGAVPIALSRVALSGGQRCPR